MVKATRDQRLRPKPGIVRRMTQMVFTDRDKSEFAARLKAATPDGARFIHEPQHVKKRFDQLNVRLTAYGGPSLIYAVFEQENPRKREEMPSRAGLNVYLRTSDGTNVDSPWRRALRAILADPGDARIQRLAALLASFPEGAMMSFALPIEPVSLSDADAVRRALDRFVSPRQASARFRVLTVSPYDPLVDTEVARDALRANLVALDNLASFIQDAAQSTGESIALTEETTMPETDAKPPLNLILYGPPGTGKTYHVIDAALERLDPDFLKSHDSRTEVKRRFDELLEAGRVQFITFHQSVGYEDFVEGLKPATDDDGALRYAIEDGVLKRLADRARVRAIDLAGLNPSGRVWKISIDGTVSSNPDSDVRAFCLEHDQIRIGWDDLRAEADLKSAPRQFLEEVAEGDLVLCIRNARSVLAVGVVAGEHRYDPQPFPDFPNVRDVRWLGRDLDVPFDTLRDKRFVQKVFYPLPDLTPAQVVEHLAMHGTPLMGTQGPPEPHVLIIDEINRGNISKIFGELITLLEPSKRLGAHEALEVVLPYSKQRFSLPGNLFVIGTMNTADRSLTLLDTALRRRFEFQEMPPRAELLRASLDDARVDLQKLLYAMNRRIELLYDRDHRIGHAYLLDVRTLSDLERVFRQRILPLLEEYFFEDWSRIREVLNDAQKLDEVQIVLERQSGEWLVGASERVSYCINTEALANPTAYTGIYEGLSDEIFDLEED